MSLFQPKTSIGLEISPTTIKLIQIRRKKENSEVTNIAFANIESDPISSLKKLLGSLKLDSKEVNTGLSGQGVVIRYIQLPNMTQEELNSAIKFEAEKHIPYPINDVYLDAKIIKESYKENNMLVLLAAAKKELIQGRINLLSSVGLEPAVVDVSVLAVINAFNFLEPIKTAPKKDEKPQPVALLNVEENIANLSILEASLPVFSRDIILGSREASLATSDSALINLANEIRLSFDFYESQENIPIANLLMSGSIGKIKGLDTFLNQNLGIEIKTWDPFSKLNFAGGLDKGIVKDRESEFTVAIGLALR